MKNIFIVIFISFYYLGFSQQPNLKNVESAINNNDSIQFINYLNHWHKEYIPQNKNELNDTLKAVYEIYEHLVDSDYFQLIFNKKDSLSYFIPQIKISYEAGNQLFNFNEKIIPVKNKRYYKYYPDQLKKIKYLSPLKYIKKVNTDNDNELMHLSNFISNHYFNKKIETKKTIKNIKPDLKTKKIIYLNDTLSIIIYNYLEHPFIDKYINALGKDITYESPYEINFINLNPSLNQAFIYLHVPCGNGYYPTFIIKENNEWKITNLIEFIQKSP